MPTNVTETKDEGGLLVISYVDTFYVNNKNFYSVKLESVKYQINRNNHLNEPNITYSQSK